jgi:hypothetical protein
MSQVLWSILGRQIFSGDINCTKVGTCHYYDL